MKHLTSRKLCEFLDDALEGVPDEEAALHLRSCPMCRARYEAWTSGDEAMREMLSQPPEEDVLEQWSSWVELAVTAERKGLPVPEFAELRLPLPPSLLPPAPEVPRVGVPPRPQGPVRFATLEEPRRGAPASYVGQAPAAPAPNTTGGIYEIAPYAASRRAPTELPRPVTVRGYARLPDSSSGWLDRLAQGLGPTSVWAPIAILFGVLVTAPIVPVIIHLTQGARPAVHDDVSSSAGAGTTERSAATSASEPSVASGRVAPAVPAQPSPPPAAEARARAASDAVQGESAAAALPQGTWPLLCGEVLDTHRAAIEGARITLAGVVVARTDRRGRFSLACPPGKRVLRVEAPGHAPATRVIVLGSKTLETRFLLESAK